MIKWLIILFALCVGIIAIILILTKQNLEINSLAQKESLTTEQMVNYSPQPLSAPETAPATLVPPLMKSGITIINQPSAEPENKILPSKIPPAEIIPAEPATQSSSQQAGVTKIGKQPTPKESREMNSQGIVLY